MIVIIVSLYLSPTFSSLYYQKGVLLPYRREYSISGFYVWLLQTHPVDGFPHHIATLDGVLRLTNFHMFRHLSKSPGGLPISWFFKKALRSIVFFSFVKIFPIWLVLLTSPSSTIGPFWMDTGWVCPDIYYFCDGQPRPCHCTSLDSSICSLTPLKGFGYYTYQGRG